MYCTFKPWMVEDEKVGHVNLFVVLDLYGLVQLPLKEGWNSD